jgi:hypothetical protein
MHVVIASERFVAIGTFARAGREALLNTILAKDVAASFDDRVLEVASADRA